MKEIVWCLQPADSAVRDTASARIPADVLTKIGSVMVTTTAEICPMKLTVVSHKLLLLQYSKHIWQIDTSGLSRASYL